MPKTAFVDEAGGFMIDLSLRNVYFKTFYQGAVPKVTFTTYSFLLPCHKHGGC